ncbi:translation initiation factor IF-2 subunit gamma [Candidatus Woesearchaeota archaeon]|nr:translation initiation factor IF-2 subunit gamma [Candidatus Woesearchaeota archaeon]
MPRAKKTDTTVQPEINIGLIGHVDHGKTTLTERLSGKWTDTHSEELKRGITIRLGYADTTFRKCGKCDEPACYTTKQKCEKDGSATVPLRKVSFVDAPGHESLMATMLSGATIMDGALLLIAANEECPQPQTREHLMALQIMGVKSVVVVQNKVDLVSKEDAERNHKQIIAFLKGTAFESAPIIPISATHNINIDLLIRTIQDTIPTPARDEKKDPIMFVARSFDINKPGTDITDLKGGVLGGALKSGRLKKGQEIEIRPGRIIEEHSKRVGRPLITKITGIMTGSAITDSVGPGGSIGVLTDLDPSIVKSDNLAGNIVGLPGKLPPVWDHMRLEVDLLKRVVGTEQELDVEPLKQNEVLMLNANSAATVGVVREFKRGIGSLDLKHPVCTEVGSRVTISRRIGNRFRLIGVGILKE